MGSREFARGRRVVARLTHGGDLLEEIAAVADAHGMAAAELRAIGALQRARLAFYDQAAHEYGEFAVDEPVELVGLLGNVSRRDGATAVHAHATLAGHDGSLRRRARGARLRHVRLRADPAGAASASRSSASSTRSPDCRCGAASERGGSRRPRAARARGSEGERVVSEGGLEPP